jgi:hypothetical protein
MVHGSIRVMPAAAMMGKAAGSATVRSIRTNQSAFGLDTDMLLATLREEAPIWRNLGSDRVWEKTQESLGPTGVDIDDWTMTHDQTANLTGAHWVHGNPDHDYQRFRRLLMLDRVPAESFLQITAQVKRRNRGERRWNGLLRLQRLC